MKRRGFFKVTGATALALGVPAIVNAQDAPEMPNDEAQVLTEISANHGHDLMLNLVDVVQMFPQTAQGESLTLDIQGLSGHPHTIDLNQEQLINFLNSGELVVTSSVDFGHAHDVRLQLVITKPV
jgi:hypothetical protein